MRAAIGHAKHRRMWCRVGCEKRVLSITTNKIDNTCSNRSQDAWRSHALRVAVGECCQFYYQNRQCRQRLVKRSTGEARTVWAAIRRYCQFQKCDEAVEGLIKIEGKIYQFNSRSELENLKIY